MIFAIPLAEKVLAGLATVAAGAGAASSVEARKPDAADAADFAKALDRLDQNGAAAPQHGTHAAGRSAPPVAG